MKRVVTVLLALVLLGQSRVAVAAYDPNESTPRQVGYGAGSAFPGGTGLVATALPRPASPRDPVLNGARGLLQRAAW